MNQVAALKLVHDSMTQATNFPAFKSGDTIIMTYRIVEGDKVREQDFRGDVIQIAGHGATRTFTVRKLSHGVGVERIIGYTNPNIVGIQVIKRGRVRRARLFYLRNLIGKAARIKELRRAVPAKA
jgi:large subunit ribosomal protein L19